jgi:hypothetical protein
MTKIDPAEIRNPKLTMMRREKEAGLDGPPVGGLVPQGEKDSGQLMFTRPLPVDPAKKKRQDRQFQELMRKREEERRKREREFETSFRDGTDDPLTDAVIASRQAVRKPMNDEDAAYRAAYQKQES